MLSTSTPPRRSSPRSLKLHAAHSQSAGASSGTPVVTTPTKIGRNDPCPCGSGKKSKRCCG
ncbi:SEC-C metal-binding domain-containing protein [Sphingomonas sp. H160509]|uniref:SEC-C metal-binding domain-containing protein n=1 Tax=Sphingomonas sp. H160509 TaxID=2955313 RepID=UPI002097E45B|nr:SEC-C metal-binding domain-containing protein [Sphingomonas sp. H160509]MDD1450860.1 SEC-C metal-binding domain-containing protein [Sphingomonas sp. H160509]